MIEIKNVSKKFNDQLVLDNINLSIKDGEKLLFVGQNGAGKSSLMRVILGEYIPTSGSVNINGFDAFKDRQNALKSVTFVPQTPPPLKLNLDELIFFAKHSANVNVNTINRLCEWLEFDLKANFKKPFYKLSGGMKQKFLIALAFSRNAKTMIFDEPTANLDPSARTQFRVLLDEFSKEKTLVFISHRLDDVNGLVKRIINMDLGKVVGDEKI